MYLCSLLGQSLADLGKTLGLINAPIVEKVKITTSVKSDAKEEQLKELERMARER